MKTTFGGIAAIAAAIACTVGAFATSASADDGSYLNSLALMGYPQDSGTQQSALKLGWAICDDLASNGDDMAGTIITLRNGGWTMKKSADWVVVADHELCPQYS